MASHAHSRQADCAGLTLAEWLCRTTDRIDPARVFGSHYCLGRGTSAPEVNFLCRLLQLRPNASVFVQGCADFPSDSSDRNHSFTTHPWRTSSSLRPGLSFRYTQACMGRTSRSRRPCARGEVLCAEPGRSHPCPDSCAGPAREGDKPHAAHVLDEKSD